MPAQITDVTERTNLRADGTFETVTVVRWMLGAHGPYTISYPSATFDPVQAQNDANTRADALARILPQT